MTRVLIYVHGHPNLKPGGSEVAAYSLYNALRHDGTVEAFFLAAQPDEEFAGQLAIHQLDDLGREFALPPLISDYFHNVGGFRNEIKLQLLDLIERLRIDVLHLHHFLGLGVDTIIQIRNQFPRLRMVFTAHEFLSICARDGQMIRSAGNELCHGAVALRCAQCHPPRRPIEFDIRREWFQRFFECFEQVISPSAFLAHRLEEWGLPGRRLAVIENVHPMAAAYERDPKPASSSVNRFGFFAQLNQYKGVNVLLDAAEQLIGSGTRVDIEIFGGWSGNNVAFHDELRARFKQLKGKISYRGGYRPAEILTLMRTVDWVVVPSIWWENSPVVIEEALISGRPLIVSDIGGMAEKVVDEEFGLHFPMGDAAGLAAVIERAAGDMALWRRLVGARRPVAAAEAVVESHLRLYGAKVGTGSQEAA